MTIAARVLGSAGILLFLAAAFSPLPNVLSRWMTRTAALSQAAAIVVLGGGGVRGDGTLSATSLRRAHVGIQLYREGVAPLLVFSGPMSSGGHIEAELRARFARECAIPAKAVLTEHTARTTREEAVHIARLLQPRGIRKIVVVTDAEGTRRVASTFENVGFEVFVAPVADVPRAGGGPEARLEVMRRVAIELVATLYYAAAGYL